MIIRGAIQVKASTRACRCDRNVTCDKWQRAIMFLAGDRRIRHDKARYYTSREFMPPRQRQAVHSSANHYRTEGRTSMHMSSPNLMALQQLRRLRGSSPNFDDQLSDVLPGEQYERSVLNLRGGDLVLLIDDSDKVCRPIPPPCSSLKPA